MTQNAELASIDVFAQNLRRLLLTAPIKNCPALGIDPGFRNGCKLALISSPGEVLETGTFFQPSSNARKNSEVEIGCILKQMLLKHKCDKIALGNGTGCRPTEELISRLISDGIFQPLNVQYCIVKETGASMYSVTKLAEDDLPGMEPNQRSAVSIERRLQDPLSEYVMIEPKHLGVELECISMTSMRPSSRKVWTQLLRNVGVLLAWT